MSDHRDPPIWRGWYFGCTINSSALKQKSDSSSKISILNGRWCFLFCDDTISPTFYPLTPMPAPILPGMSLHALNPILILGYQSKQIKWKLTTSPQTPQTTAGLWPASLSWLLAACCSSGKWIGFLCRTGFSAGRCG